MYQTILVTNDVENGRRIVDKLEENRLLKVAAAFWFHFEEEDQWKLVVVSPDVAEKGSKVLYTWVSTLLYDLANDPQKPLEFPMDRIILVSPYSLLYKMVKQHAGPVGGPVREGPVLDAYIYKMA
ncbi:MAG TPA: hypothetical protein VMH80_10690 [Bryobacteraceae bacterium]|nr:hypothetical protein [Bryobacteraceae bacterium]